jgi:Ca2+/Na+ antiporter
MIWTALILTISLLSIIAYLRNIVLGQQQAANNTNDILFSANESVTNEITDSLQKLIQQNDDASESALIGSYIGMLAFLTGLALVIFGLQMSRGDKITPISRIYYRILILVLVLPVIGIIIFAFVNQVNPEYLGVISLLLIPAGAVLVLSQFRKLLDKL